MDPTFTSDRPGRSPMGMDLVPVYASGAEPLPLGTVRIDPGFVQSIGVRTAPVARANVAQTIRTVGTLAHNDRQIAWVKPSALRDILVRTPTRQQIPLGHLATMSFVKGPPAIKSEQARPNAWVYVDIEDVDIGTYVERARQAVAAQVEIPTGYSLGWSGQYEYMVRAQERMRLVVPLTLLLIFLTIYASTQSVARTLIVLSAVPLSLIGTFWLLYALDYNLSIAVWVGIIALAGLSAETGVVMLLYLDRACDAARTEGRLRTLAELRQAVFDGAARRGRPVVMLSATTVLGLLPIMWSTGTGTDVMKRIAAPMVGGVVTTAVVVLLVFPAVYCIWRGWGVSRRAGAAAAQID